MPAAWSLTLTQALNLDPDMQMLKVRLSRRRERKPKRVVFAAIFALKTTRDGIVKGKKTEFQRNEALMRLPAL